MRESDRTVAVQDTPWAGREATPSASARVESAERQLALVDRVLGLEAALAELAVESSLTPSEQLIAERQLVRLRGSTAWRIGNAATAPARIARRTLRRGA